MITNNKLSKKERITCQKKAILDYLTRTKNHSSAEEIYRAVKKKLPQISKGTVYRVLKEFKEKGKISGIDLEVALYETGKGLHAHFICEKCGKVFDVFGLCEEFTCLLKGKRRQVGKISAYQIYLYGTCKNCLLKGNKNNAPRENKKKK
jgi:Fe2+ or Zn2+ uptake regulation protein